MKSLKKWRLTQWYSIVNTIIIILLLLKRCSLNYYSYGQLTQGSYNQIKWVIYHVTNWLQIWNIKNGNLNFSFPIRKNGGKCLFFFSSFSKARAKIYLLPTFAHFGILDQGPVSVKKKSFMQKGCYSSLLILRFRNWKMGQSLLNYGNWPIKCPVALSARSWGKSFLKDHAHFEKRCCDIFK